MLTKQDLKNHLQQISEDAAFVKFVFVSSEKFSVELKCKVEPDQPEYNHFVADWIKKFSSFTATAWIVRNSFPNRKRMAYRKLYACHRSSFNKKPKLTADDTRNQECLAKIDFRVKFINRNTIKNDPLLKEGLNMTITIEFVHTHKLRTAEAFHLLKSTSETDELFYSYLSNGYSVTTATLYHELTLIDRYGNRPEILMNANMNPTKRHVRYLQKKLERNSEEKSFDDIMAAKKAKLECSGGFISYSSRAITLVTGTMRRVMSSSSLDHVLVGNADVSGWILTSLYVPSKAGALLVACVFHREQIETDYTQAFLAVKSTLDSICAGFEPKVITLKDCKELRATVTAIFPNSTILTSKRSICCEIWRWMNGDDIKINSEKRQSVMRLFYKLIMAKSLPDAELAYSELKDDESVKNSAVVSEFVDDLWEKREQWLCADDQGYMKVVGASMQLIDEFIRRKCKAFNVYAMLDAVFNLIDVQIRRILQAHVTGDNVAAVCTRFLVSSNPECGPEVNRVGPSEFSIETNTKPKKCIKFNIDTWCCDCPEGSKGRFCEHLCSIINTIETDLFKPCELTDEEKCLLTEIVGELEEPKIIKSEFLDNKLTADESNYEIDENYSDKEMDNVFDNDNAENQSVTSTKSEANDNYYYLDVKTEHLSVDPLEEPSFEDETSENLNITNMYDYNMPTTSRSISSKQDMKGKYEDAMKGLNDEFRRLNKLFKQNPNKGNMETMLRLARELSKIRPIEKVKLNNLKIIMNTQNENKS